MPSISDYIQDLNTRIFLPGLQREFVWSKNQTANLFDSLIREYPVGMITRWDVAHSNADYYPYKFIENFVDDDRSVPEEITEAGYERYNDEVDEDDGNSVLNFLIIDGQQRLTSLFIGLFGQRLEYTKGRGGTRSNINHWSAYELCINLFGHPDFDEDDNLAGDYEFEFRTTGQFHGRDQMGYTESSDGTQRYWFPLPKMMTEDREVRNMRDLTDEIHEQIADISVSSDRRQRFRDIRGEVLPKIESRILDAELPKKDVKKSSSEIKEIFQRINIEGESPDPYQLLLSRMMSTWPFTEPEADQINPRRLTENWVQEFKQRHSAYERKINREIFMRFSVYLIDDVLKTGPISNLSEQDLLNIRGKWLQEPENGGYPEGSCRRFQDALDSALWSLATLGFSETTMGTMPIVAALAKFYYEHPEADYDDQENLEQIYRFVSKLRLLKRSKGSVSRVQATRLSHFLHGNQDKVYSVFPADDAFDHLDVEIAEDTVENMVKEARYGSGNTDDGQFGDWEVAAILNLSTPTFELMDVDSVEVDHIFPASRAEYIREQADVPEEEFTIHRVGNLQLLPAKENRQKGDDLPVDWINTLNDGEADRYRRVNNYPDESLDPTRYQNFVEKREAALAETVLKNL